MRKLLFVMLLSTLQITGAAAEQVCSHNVRHTAPTHRFQIQDGGIVIDTRTGLTWMRCPVGFEINDNETADDQSDDLCSKTTEDLYFEWQSALERANSVNTAGGIAGFTDWRLPNMKELVSIVERKCLQPAQNTAVFPALTFPFAWTSTTYNRLDQAAYVDFEYGNNDEASKNLEYLVRLVR